MPAGFPYHGAEEIRALVAEDADYLNAFRARASLSIASPAQSGSFTADITHRRADSLLMSISPGLGIEAARALVTPDSFFVFDRIRRQVTYGSLAEAAHALPSVLVGDDLFANLLGLVRPEEGVNWRVQADGSNYYLLTPDGLTRYTIDPTIWRVTHYEDRLRDGTLVEERVFSGYEVIDGVLLPRRVVLSRPLEETTVALHYRSITPDPPVLSLKLGAPDNIPRVPAS
jgi:hypothetical protein